MTASAPPDAEFRLWRSVLLVFFPFAGGYFLSYLLRSVNAVIAPQLIEELGLNAGDLGLLTSAYFLAFASFQVPLGVLLDRYGPRRVQAVLLLSAALGALLFSQGETRVSLVVARALIGLGFAGGLMSSFKAITLWFPQARWPLVNGFFLSMGGLGAVSATRPVEALLGLLDWRGVFLTFSIAIVCVSSIILLVVPERRHVGQGDSLREQLQGLVVVWSNRYFWKIAPVALTSMAIGLAVQGLWAGPWFRDVAGLDRTAVANALFMLTLGLTAGMVGSGLLAEAFARIGIGVLGVMKLGLLIYFAVQAIIVWQWLPDALWPWMVFGFLSNICVLAYPQLSSHFPLHYSGTANAGLNVLVMLGAFAAQYGIGAIIDLWPLAADGGYLPEAHRGSLGAMLALQVVCYLWLFVPQRRKTAAAAADPA